MAELQRGVFVTNAPSCSICGRQGCDCATATYNATILRTAWNLATYLNERDAFPEYCRMLAASPSYLEEVTANLANLAAGQGREAQTGQFLPVKGTSHAQAHGAARGQQGQGQQQNAPQSDEEALDALAEKAGMSTDELKEHLGIPTEPPAKPKGKRQPTTTANCACGGASLTAAADLSRQPPSMRQPARRPKATIGRPWVKPFAMFGLSTAGGRTTRKLQMAAKRAAIKANRLARNARGVVL